MYTAGAGVFGLATALKLHEAGKKTVVLEAHRVGMGVGGYSTAKLCSLQRSMYSIIGSKFGEDVVKAYGSMSQEGTHLLHPFPRSSWLTRVPAIDEMERVVNKYDIDCSFKRSAHTCFATKEDEKGMVQSESEGATTAGTPFVQD